MCSKSNTDPAQHLPPPYTGSTANYLDCDVFVQGVNNFENRFPFSFEGVDWHNQREG